MIATKLQLESKGDLAFVFEGINNKAHEVANQKRLDKSWNEVSDKYQTQGASFENAVEDKVQTCLNKVIEMAQLNCQVNGKDWPERDEVLMTEEFAPVDEKLMLELMSIQQKVDASLSDLVKLKNKRRDEALSGLDKINETRRKARQHTVSNAEEIGFALAEDFEAVNENLSEDIISTLDNMQHLAKELPALVSRLSRYREFIQDEIGDEDKYRAHQERLKVLQPKDDDLTKTVERKMWKVIEQEYQKLAKKQSAMQ